MSIISRLIGAGDLLLYHDYRSGSFRDFSGNNNHGSVTGSPTLQRSGVAFNAASGQYITAGADTLGTGAGSVIVCCNPKNYGQGNYGRLFDNGAFSMYKASNTRLQVGFNPFPATPIGSLNFGVHQIIICSWNASGTSNTYINNSNVLPSESIGTPSAGTTYTIGNRIAHDRQFGGLITGILVINRELTASEVSEITIELCNKKWNQKTITHSVVGNSGLPLDEYVKASYSLPSVVDLTGNGYNGTLVGSPRKGKKSIGEFIDILDNASNYVSMPLTIWPGTTGAFEFITKCHSAGAGSARLFGFNDTGNEEMRAYSNVDGKVLFYYWGDGAIRNTGGTTEFTYGNIHHVVFQWEYDGSTNTTYKVFVNGVETDSDTWADPHPVPDIDASLGVWGSSSYDGEIYEFAVHTTARTATQWAERMKQFFAREAIGLGNGALETVSNVTSGPLPGTPFEVYSGTFKTTYDTINGKPVKVIECVAAGVIYSPWSRFQNNNSEAAYGTWDYWLSKAAGSSSRIMPMALEPGPYNVSATQDGYMIDTAVNENIVWRRVDNGGLVQLFNTATGVASEAVFENYKITRTSSGLFSLYLNGAVLDTPAIENTYTSGKYINLDLDAGDKIAIAGFDGTPLFVKRKGVA